jgi:uncharacterized paraquat-inducible protein A
MTRHAVSTRVHRQHACTYRLTDGRVQPWTCERCETTLTSNHPHELHLAVAAHIDAERSAA